MTAQGYKDPDSILDFGFDYAKDGFLDDGDSIQASSWFWQSEDDDCPTITIHDHTATTTTVWLSGGTAEKNYVLVNRIVTVGGRTDDHTLRIYVRER